MHDGVVANSEIVDLETSQLIGDGEAPSVANIRRRHALGEGRACRGNHPVRPCVDNNLPTFG